MGKFDNIIICCDYDGTLTKNGVHVVSGVKKSIDNICEESQNAVRYFAFEGGRFIIASGRSPQGMSFLYDFLPIDDLFAGVNGTVLYSHSKDEIVYKHVMKTDAIALVEDVMTAIDGIPEYHVVTGDLIVHLWTSDLGVDWREFLRALNGQAVLKVIFDSRDDLALMDRIEEYVVEKYSSLLEINKSCPHFLECNDIGSGKGDIVKYLKANFEGKTIIALGDYGNDKSMFEVADYAYCPENATDEIKSLATKVFREAKDGFVADVVAEIENNLCKSK